MNEENNNIFNEQQPVNPQQQTMSNLESAQSIQTKPPLSSVPPKKSKGPLVIIILLLLAVLGMAGYICYDEFITKDTPKEVKKTEKKKSNNDDTTDKKVKKTEEKENNNINKIDDITDKEIDAKIAELEKSDYYIKFNYYIKFKLDQDNSVYLDKKIGTFKIDGKSNDVKISREKDNQSQENYVISIGNYKIKYPYARYYCMPDWIALMDEKYVALFIEGGSDNEIVLFDLSGKRVEVFGNTLGEVESSSTDDVGRLIIDNKNFNYYDCKFNNGPGTETLTKYNVKFENGKYIKEVLSTKQNVSCLVGG